MLAPIYYNFTHTKKSENKTVPIRELIGIFSLESSLSPSLLLLNDLLNIFVVVARTMSRPTVKTANAAVMKTAFVAILLGRNGQMTGSLQDSFTLPPVEEIMDHQNISIINKLTPN